METAALIAAISAAIKLVDSGMSALEEIRAKGGKEWTAAQEAEYDNLVAQRMALDHWKKSGRTK